MLPLLLRRPQPCSQIRIVALAAQPGDFVCDEVLSTIGRVLAWIFVIALVLACIGPLVASSIYLDRNGVIGPGKVIDKDEDIRSASDRIRGSAISG